jgi:hypothetical protein
MDTNAPLCLIFDALPIILLAIKMSGMTGRTHANDNQCLRSVVIKQGSNAMSFWQLQSAKVKNNIKEYYSAVLCSIFPYCSPKESHGEERLWVYRLPHILVFMENQI